MSDRANSSPAKPGAHRQYQSDRTGKLVEGEEGVYRTHHDMSTDGLTTTISIALAELSGGAESELISDFSTYADPDALDRLFRTKPGSSTRDDGRVSLRIEEYWVTVRSDGTILIEAS